MRHAVFLGPLALLCSIAPAMAAEWDLSGHVELESRFFPDDPAFAGQDDTRLSGSLAAEPSLRFFFNDGWDELTLTPFARLDSHDAHRSHVDLREANWLHVGEGWDLVLGIDRVFWGVTESRHLVDIVNQTDGVEAIDGEEKLGQPMLNLNLLADFGTFRFYVLPGFRERTFPADDARLRGPLPIAADGDFGRSAGHDEVAFAVRYTHSLGPFDLGLAHFHGTGREPRLLLDTTAGGAPFLQPFYERIDQTSLDLQATFGAWLWKLEALTRSGQGDRVNAFVAGAEYTFFDVLGSDASLGLLGEYLYDDRDLEDFAAIGAGIPYDDDLFFGTRLALNDLAGSQLLAGAIIDRENATTAASLEASRRLGDSWRIELEARAFLNVAFDDILRAVRDDDHLILRLKRYF